MSRASFEVYYYRGRIYLQLTGGSAAAVYPEDVQNRMRLLELPRVSAGRIREALEKLSSEPLALMDWADGSYLAARISVSRSEDDMSAAVVVTQPQRGAAAPRSADVVEALEEAGVVHGIDREAISRLLADARWNESQVVAQGTEPVFGRGRQIAFHFELNRGKPYLELPFGRIDLRELNFIDNRHSGDLLAELLPPVQPRDGRSVAGAPIAAERDDTLVVLPSGENTRLEDDGSRLLASIDGNVRFRDGLIIVEPVVEVENVDYSTGNIHFEGSVVVKGHVADGFELEASGNIQVGKSVGRARLVAGENILLTTGINGNGEGYIEAGGNIFARYIEHCTVRSGTNLFVEEAIMHSTVRVQGNCILNGRRAELIAGDTIVGGSLWCRKLGNIYDAVTRVAVGLPPRDVEAYRHLRERMRNIEERLDTLDEQVSRLDRAIEEGRSDERVVQARAQLAQEQSELNDELAGIRPRLPRLRDAMKPAVESILVAEEVMYKGSIVAFGTHEYRAPESGSWKTVLRLAHGEIHAGGFDASDPPVLSFPDADDSDGAGPS